MRQVIRGTIRMLTPFSVMAFAAFAARGQDPIQAAVTANQQAIQQMQQASRQALQQSQQATQAMQAQQDLIRARSEAIPSAYVVATPRISVKGGQYPGPLTVRLKDSTRGAVIYYTTDGWTPTVQSARYVGPISVASDTTLQAIAVDGGNGRSRIATARYTLPPPAAGSAAGASNLGSASADAPGKGLEVRVVFTAPFSSRGVQVGDPVPVALAEDTRIQGVLVSRGTPVAATVTHIDGPGWSGLPASITFELHSVSAGARAIPLTGSATKDGPEPNPGRQILPFYRGRSVEIPSGAELTGLSAAN